MLNREDYMTRSLLETKIKMEEKQNLMDSLLDLKANLNSFHKDKEDENIPDEIICQLNAIEDTYNIQLSRESKICLQDEVNHHLEKIKLELQSFYTDFQQSIVDSSAIISITKDINARNETKRIIENTGR